jgi:universal protein Kae1
MHCLGIEATAHTWGIAIVDGKGNVLANERDIYKPPMGWGIHPIEAAKHHEEVGQRIYEAALAKAGLDLNSIDFVAFSQAPGLAPCLYKGLNFAEKLGKPIIGVNHCIAHVEIGRMSSGLADPITLYTSGANTQVLGFVSGRYRCFGETMDVGIGNALDKFGRETGIAFPAGPKIEELAKSGKYVELPYVVKGMDLSFSGVVTDAVQRFRKGAKIEDLCFSIQETFFAMLAEVTERALAHTGKNECLLTGGVAANKRLQEMMAIMCKERGTKFYSVPRELAGDNAAMIAWTGVLMKNAGMHTKNEILPRQRTDEVDVKWINGS